MAQARAAAFTSTEVGIALAVAGAIQITFFTILILAGEADAKLKAHEEPVTREIPIAVKPMLDETPLLKLGSKKKARLPDMWKKKAPVKRYEDKSAPSPKAEKTPEAIPTSEVVTKDAEAPPPDAEVAKVVDEPVLADAAAPEEITAEGEGTPDGVKEGTETDPLKGRAVGAYRAKLIGWFSSRFHVPPGAIPCDELKTLSSSVSASISPDGTVTGFSVNRPSGNSVFDGRVESTMQGVVGDQVPPPPPLYPDVLPPSLALNFLGKNQRCE